MIQKLIIGLFILISLLSLTACQAVNSVAKLGGNYISETKLTDREKQLLSTINHRNFIFDYKVNNDSKYINAVIWVERHEFGKKISELGKLTSSISHIKEGMILATMSEYDNMNHNWVISAGNGICRFNDEYKADQNKNYSQMSLLNTNTIQITDNEILLGVISYIDQSKEIPMNASDYKFFNNPNENLKEIESYDLVYLIKCRFYKEGGLAACIRTSALGS